MSVTEPQRHRLYESLKSTLGEDNADTFMSLTPPTDWSGVATNDHVDALEARVNDRFDAFEARVNDRFDAFEARVNERFELIEQRLALHDARFDRLEQQFDTLRDDVAHLRPELQRTLGTWIFASQAAVVTILSVVTTVLLAVMR